LEWGKGYSLVNDEFLRALTKLSLLPYGLWMTSHSQEKEIKSRTGSITKVSPTLASSARKIVLGMSDFILYAESVQTKDKGELRVLHTKPTENYEAGDRTGRLPATMEFKFATFLDKFNGGADDEPVSE
jgi:hypothetical protein